MSLIREDTYTLPPLGHCILGRSSYSDSPLLPWTTQGNIILPFPNSTTEWKIDESIKDIIHHIVPVCHSILIAFIIDSCNSHQESQTIEWTETLERFLRAHSIQSNIIPASTTSSTVRTPTNLFPTLMIRAKRHKSSAD